MSPDIARSNASPDASAIAPDPALNRVHPRVDWRVQWRAVLSFAACVAYPFLVYWVLAQRHPWLGWALTLTALVGLCLCLPHRRTRLLAILAVVVLTAAAVAFASPAALLFLPPLGVNLGLAWYFGSSLVPGREALITRFARFGQDDLAPAVVAYTRRLTWVWTGFFLIMAAVSIALAAFGAHAAWVWFTAVGNYLCVAALFALEYAWRRRRFPRSDSPSPRQQILMLRAALRDRRR